MAEFWIGQAKCLLRKISPIDFPEGLPIYVCDRNGLGPDFDCQNSFGFTNAMLDLRLQPILEERGEWFGRGFCCVINTGLIRSKFPLSAPGDFDSFFSRIALHEAIHHFQFGRITAATEREENLAESLKEVLAEFRASTVEEMKASSPDLYPWTGHDATFGRLAIHIAFRARNAGFGVHPNQLWDAERYGFGCTESHIEALGDEPQRRSKESFFDISESTPPAGYVRFADEDLEAAKERHARL
jgi:hypothetical protein